MIATNTAFINCWYGGDHHIMKASKRKGPTKWPGPRCRTAVSLQPYGEQRLPLLYSSSVAARALACALNAPAFLPLR